MFSIKTFPFEIEGTKLGRILTLPGHNLLEEKLLIGDTITIWSRAKVFLVQYKIPLYLLVYIKYDGIY